MFFTKEELKVAEALAWNIIKCLGRQIIQNN